MKGSCHCGEIQFEVMGKPTWLGRCHCRDCQKISGSAFIAFAEYKLDDVQFIKGTPAPYKSSSNVTRTFCGKCGSPIEWKRDDMPQKTSLALGLFDEKYDFSALDDLYEEESPSWK
jgi:hypothetical protein